MSPQDLVVGRAYYRVTYADPDLTIPGVDPMIYVGTNIADGDDPQKVVYYFQDSLSHAHLGPVTDPNSSEHDEIEFHVFPHEEAEVHSSVFTLDEVISALTDARNRLEVSR